MSTIRSVLRARSTYRRLKSIMLSMRCIGLGFIRNRLTVVLALLGTFRCGLAISLECWENGMISIPLRATHFQSAAAKLSLCETGGLPPPSLRTSAPGPQDHNLRGRTDRASLRPCSCVVVQSVFRRCIYHWYQSSLRDW